MFAYSICGIIQPLHMNALQATRSAALTGASDNVVPTFVSSSTRCQVKFIGDRITFSESWSWFSFLYAIYISSHLFKSMLNALWNLWYLGTGFVIKFFVCSIVYTIQHRSTISRRYGKIFDKTIQLSLYLEYSWMNGMNLVIYVLQMCVCIYKVEFTLPSCYISWHFLARW